MNDMNTTALNDYERRQELAERIEAAARAEAERDIDAEPEVLVEDLTKDEAIDLLQRIVCARAGLTGTDEEAIGAEAVKIFTELRAGAIEAHVARALDMGSWGCAA